MTQVGVFHFISFFCVLHCVEQETPAVVLFSLTYEIHFHICDTGTKLTDNEKSAFFHYERRKTTGQRQRQLRTGFRGQVYDRVSKPGKAEENYHWAQQQRFISWMVSR